MISACYMLQPVLCIFKGDTTLLKEGSLHIQSLFLMSLTAESIFIRIYFVVTNQLFSFNHSINKLYVLTA